MSKIDLPILLDDELTLLDVVERIYSLLTNTEVEKLPTKHYVIGTLIKILESLNVSSNILDVDSDDDNMMMPTISCREFSYWMKTNESLLIMKTQEEIDRVLNIISQDEMMSEVYEVIRSNGKLGPNPRTLSASIFWHLSACKIPTDLLSDKHTTRAQFQQWLNDHSNQM